LAFSREREEMRARIRGAFSTSYLTLLSIIQGTAFAALFAKVDSLVTQHSFHAPQAVMAFGLLLLIVALWNQYLIGTMLYNWTLVLTDSILPFTFGVFEFAMILELQDGVAVLTINGLFLLMGVVGLEHQYRQARRSESAEFTAHVARGFRAVDVTSSVVIGVLLLGAAALISRFGQSTLSGLVAAGIIVAVALANLAREAHQWNLVQQRLSEMTE
jgi:hypothetical protein